MFSVFLTKICFLYWYSPVYTKTIIKNIDATIRLWMIELITLILEYGCFTQYGKAMCKSTRHEELAVVFFSQFHCYVMTVCFRFLTNIHSDIKHYPFYTTYQFTLCVRRSLEM